MDVYTVQAAELSPEAADTRLAPIESRQLPLNQKQSWKFLISVFRKGFLVDQDIHARNGI